MNLFRSEEHVRNWSGYQADTEEGILQLSDLVMLFSVNMFKRRLDPDYISRIGEYRMELLDKLKNLGSFWQPPG